MAGTVNLASKFEKWVDEAFARESILTGATNNRVDFTGVNEVSVYSVDKMDMNDYQRSGTNRYGTPEEIGDTVQTFKITKDRSFTGTIDEGNAQDQYNIKGASERLHIQMREVVTPEIEQYVLQVWAEGAGKSTAGTAPTAETLLGLIQTGASYMNNHHVPKRGRSIFIAETYAAMLPNLANLTYLERLGSQALTENKLPRVAGFDVHVVPDTDMPTGVYFILQHKDACPFVKKLQTLKVHKDPPGINGNLIEGRVRYWAGVLSQKADGIYAYVATANKQTAVTIGATGVNPTLTSSGASAIYYTLDGSDPRFSDSRVQVATGGSITGGAEGMTLKAVAYANGKLPSDVAEKVLPGA